MGEEGSLCDIQATQHSLAARATKLAPRALQLERDTGTGDSSATAIACEGQVDVSGVWHAKGAVMAPRQGEGRSAKLVSYMDTRTLACAAIIWYSVRWFPGLTAAGHAHAVYTWKWRSTQ